MTNKFILKNVRESLKKDTYYRLDIVTGIDLTNDYRVDQIFTTLRVNFCEYSPAYQNLKKIKSIAINNRFKNSINAREKITVETVSLLEDITNQFFLKPGTVWKNGELVWEPSDSLNIYINQEQKTITNFKTVKAELSKKNIQYIKDNHYTNLIKLPESEVNGKKVTVLVPTLEVIRYYFSGSRYFTTSLFNGGMESDQIKSAFIYKSTFDKEQLNVYIWLRRKCYDSDAILLARAIANTRTMNSMRLIYSSLISVISFYTQKQWQITQCCPKADFPFSDNNELEVQGQWLPPNEQGEFTTYLVRTIEKCNHNLPFKSLEIESVESYNTNGKASSKATPYPTQTIVREDGEHKLVLTEGEQPSEAIEAQELAFYTERFSHLSEIHISKVSKSSEKEQQKYASNEKIKPETDEGSTQTGNYQQDNHMEAWEVAIKDGESIPINERLNVTSEAIKSIEKRSNSLSVVALPFNKLDTAKPYGFYEFKAPPRKPSNYTWPYMGNRKRKALFLELKSGQKTIYILEIEGKKGAGHSLYLLSQSNMNNFTANAESFLQRIAEKSGNGIKHGLFNKIFTVTSLKHTTNKEDSFTDRLIRSINDAFNPSHR